MSMQRITISLPEKTHQELLQMVATGSISQFVTKAIKKQIIEDQENSNPWEDMRKLAKYLPKMSHDEILETIHQGRK